MRLKKLLLTICFAVVLAVSLGLKPVNASLETNDIFRIDSEEEVRYLLGGVKLHIQKVGAKKDCQGNYYYPYDTFYLETAPQSENVKIVTWSYRNTEKWQMNGVSEIARNFEEQNPGWIVVGGTNADFFQINGNGQMESTAVENGEFINSRDISSNVWWRGILGFTKDNTLITGIPTRTAGFNLHIYEDSKMDNEISSISNISINPGTISQTGITLLTKDKLDKYDLTGFKVLVGRYDLCRVTYTNDYYLKGTVHTLRDGTTDEHPYDLKPVPNEDRTEVVREFFLVSKDGSLDDIELNKYIQVQRDLTGAYADVHNAASYYWKILDNGTVMFEGHSTPAGQARIKETYGQGYNDLSYITCTKARCLFGQRADGSYVMCSISGSTSSGMTLSEGAYFMKEIGCVNAWDFDGGGSATIVARNDEGKIETINTPSDAGDGTERRVGNAILMVVRDSGFKVKQKESTPSTVTLEKKTGEELKNMKNITIELNGKTYNVADDQEKIEIKGLKENTRYYATVKYDFEGEAFTTTLPITTKPYISGVDFNPLSTGFEMTLWNSDEILYTSKIEVNVDGETYVIDNADGTLSSYIIDGLFKDEEYRISYSYEVTNKETGEKYTKEEPEMTFRTLSYSLPTIKSFEATEKRGGRVQVEYNVSDADSLITDFVVLHNGEKTDAIVGNETIGFEDIDLTSSKHVFQLVITFEDPDGKIKTITSEEIILGSEETPDTPVQPEQPVTPQIVPTPKKKGCKKKQSALAITSAIALLAACVVVFKKRR